MKRCRVLIGALPLALSLATTMLGSELRLEPEFVASPWGRAPSVAISKNGDFAIAWVVRSAYARVYSARGEPRGPAFLLSEDENQFAAGLEVAASDRGEFVAVWAANVAEGQTSAKLRIVARRFNRHGELLDPPRLVSSTTELPRGAQEQMPVVGMDDRGRFVVAWSPDPAVVEARSFDRNGAPLGPNFRVHEGGDARLARIAMHRDGSFLLCWSTNLGGQLVAGARARVFQPNGEPLSSEIVLNTDEGQQGCTGVGRGRKGGYTVAWTGRMGSERGTFARELDGVGNRIGDPVRLIPFEPFADVPPVFAGGASVAGSGASGVLAVWDGLDPNQLEDSTWAVRARQFSSDLWPLSSTVQISGPTRLGSTGPAAACTATGSCIIVWQRGDHNQDESPEIHARRLKLGGR